MSKPSRDHLPRELPRDGSWLLLAGGEPAIIRHDDEVGAAEGSGELFGGVLRVQCGEIAHRGLDVRVAKPLLQGLHIHAVAQAGGGEVGTELVQVPVVAFALQAAALAEVAVQSGVAGVSLEAAQIVALDLILGGAKGEAASAALLAMPAAGS